MGQYADPQTGLVSEIENPGMNKEAIGNKVQVPDNTPTGSTVNVSTLTPGTDLSKSVISPNSTPITYPPSQPTQPNITTLPSGLQGTVDEKGNFTPLPQPTPTSPSSPASPAVTPAEQAVQDAIKTASGSENALVGKEAYTAEQQNTFGVPQLNATKNDLSSQILALQAEAKNIPMSMQQQAEGRGITDAGLAPLTAGALRENAIKANILTAQLDAINGKLATANYGVERAVAMKFGPLEEANKAALKNLALLKENPQLSVDEKARAAATEIQLRQKEAEIAQQKTNQAEIWKMATTAASYVNNFKATPQYPSAGIALKAIQDAPTKEEGLRIATITGLTGKPSYSSLGEFERAFIAQHGTPPTVEDIVNYKAEIARAGKPEIITPENKYLNAADAKSLNDANKGANITVNDTRATAQQKIDSLDPVKLETLITAAKNNNHSYDTVVKEIQNDRNLSDKDLALQTAAKVYGRESQAKKGFWATLFGQ